MYFFLVEVSSCEYLGLSTPKFVGHQDSRLETQTEVNLVSEVCRADLMCWKLGQDMYGTVLRWNSCLESFSFFLRHLTD